MSKRLFANSIATLSLLCFTLSASVFFFDEAVAAGNGSKPPYLKWIVKPQNDHPLIGKIWATKHNKFIAAGELADALSINDFILLGEVHDNPDHHKLQAWLINKIVRHNRKPVIIMEMIDEEQQPGLDEYIKEYKNPTADLGRAIGWSKKGWPDWSIYRPIARTAYAHRLKIAYGSAKKETTRNISKKGFDGIDAAFARQLTLDKNIGSNLVTNLTKELEASHCGLLKGQPLRKMAKVQHFRDALMANQMMSAGERRGAFLIAGNGHVRTDRGVPYFLKRQDPYYLSVSLMLVEVTDGENEPDNLVPKDSSGQPATDFVWFTPKKKRPDPCKKLKKHFHKKQKPEKS